jgi:hypothetical protein
MGLGVEGHNRTASYPDGVQWKWNANKGGEHQVREEDARARVHTHTHTHTPHSRTRVHARDSVLDRCRERRSALQVQRRRL